MRSAPGHLLADIAVEARTAGSEALFTYAVPAGTVPGQAFLIPLGARQVIGHVVATYPWGSRELGFPVEKLRSVGEPLSGLSLPPPTIDLVKFVAEEYLCSVPAALSPASPPGAAAQIRRQVVAESVPPEVTLTNLQREVFAGIVAAGGTLDYAKVKKLEPGHQKAIRALVQFGCLRMEADIGEDRSKNKPLNLYARTPNSQAVEEFLEKHGKRRPAQALTLMRLGEVQEASLTLADIKSLCGVTDQTVRSLIDAGLIVQTSLQGWQPARAPDPNGAQVLAIEALADAVSARRSEGFLLFGVTGSGKTEVYLRAAAEALRIGRKVLFLVPEIALATQAVAGLRDRFGPRVAILHSELSPRERLANWLSIRSGESPLVLGARSAIFAPLDDIGLIVVDEEHESSYKQESTPRYHAKRLTQFLSERHGCPVVYGSATPSLESFVQAERDQLTLLSLPERAASALLPTVRVEDLSEGFRTGAPKLFSPQFEQGLRQAVDSGHQAILFLNRRAYAPFLICRDCGFVPDCANCAVSMAYTRKSQLLRCHHCGSQRTVPQTCPKCGGSRLKTLGVGTEKVEEAVAELLPDVTVGRLDRDVTQRKGALEDVLSRFASREIQVLVGTQMVAKGLNFPNVTFVGVVAADISLTIPDFRASERTFQLLAQVAGRAGRGAAAGEVVIQTFNPNHPAIRYAEVHDTVGFLEGLRAEREAAGYPPFRRLVNVVVTGENLAQTESVARSVARSAVTLLPSSAEVLGPVDCAIERIQNRWRRHVLIKVQPQTAVHSLRGLMQHEEGDVQITVDVDPYNLI